MDIRIRLNESVASITYVMIDDQRWTLESDAMKV
jgi:hypothetical protein